MGFDFAQELRATSLRLEKFLQKQGVKLQQQINDKLREISGELPLSLQDVSYSCDLEFVTAFQQVEDKYFQSALAIYKNPKAFFEGGGSREMADALEKLLHPLADKYLAQQQEMLAQEIWPNPLSHRVYIDIVKIIGAIAFAADLPILLLLLFHFIEHLLTGRD